MKKRCETCRHFTQQEIALVLDDDLGRCAYPVPWDRLPETFAAKCRSLGTPVMWKWNGERCATWGVHEM